MTADRLIRLKEVMNRCGLCRSAVFALSKEGKFPPSISLAGTRAVAWQESKVNEWIEQQIKHASIRNIVETSTPITSGWVTGRDAAREAV